MGNDHVIVFSEMKPATGVRRELGERKKATRKGGVWREKTTYTLAEVMRRKTCDFGFV